MSDSTLQSRIKAALAEQRTQLTAELSHWVAQNTLPGREAPLQAHICGLLTQIGLDAHLQSAHPAELASHPLFCGTRTTFEGSPNLIARTRPGKHPGRSILLNGHIDVVPTGDIKLWERDPFSGFYDAATDRLYGRGVTDMKGGLFAQYAALRVLHGLGIALNGVVHFHSVIEEETGGAGTLSAMLVERDKIDVALITEPTGMKIFPKQQGSLWFRIKVPGKGAHGGTRYEGVSALEKAILVISALQKLERDRNAPLKASGDPLFASLPIPVPINIGKVHGGEWPSSVPDLVTLEGRLGVIPGESLDSAKSSLAAALSALNASDSFLTENPVTHEWFGARWLPGAVPSEHAFLDVLSSAFARVAGTPPKVEASPWGTDGGLLGAVAGIPAVVLGPGVTKMAHKENEYIVVEDVLRCAEIIALALVEWCGVSE